MTIEARHRLAHVSMTEVLLRSCATEYDRDEKRETLLQTSSLCDPFERDFRVTCFA